MRDFADGGNNWFKLYPSTSLRMLRRMLSRVEASVMSYIKIGKILGIDPKTVKKAILSPYPVIARKVKGLNVIARVPKAPEAISIRKDPLCASHSASITF